MTDSPRADVRVGPHAAISLRSTLLVHNRGARFPWRVAKYALTDVFKSVLEAGFQTRTVDILGGDALYSEVVVGTETVILDIVYILPGIHINSAPGAKNDRAMVIPWPPRRPTARVWSRRRRCCTCSPPARRRECSCSIKCIHNG